MWGWRWNSFLQKRQCQTSTSSPGWSAIDLYRYPHDEGGFAEGAAYLPDALAGARYYEPTDAGFEARIKARLAALRAGPRPDGRDDDEGR